MVTQKEVQIKQCATTIITVILKYSLGIITCIDYLLLTRQTKQT